MSWPVIISLTSGITPIMSEIKLKGANNPLTCNSSVSLSYSPANSNFTASPLALTFFNIRRFPIVSIFATPTSNFVPSPSIKEYKPVSERTDNALIDLGASTTLKSVTLISVSKLSKLLFR